MQGTTTLNLIVIFTLLFEFRYNSGRYMSRKFIECGFRENRGRIPDFIARRKGLSYLPKLLSDLGKMCVHRSANNALRY